MFGVFQNFFASVVTAAGSVIMAGSSGLPLWYVFMVFLVVYVAVSVGLVALFWLSNGIYWIRNRSRISRDVSATQEAVVEISGQTFENSTILLDNRWYRDCKFLNCSFRWNGGQFGIESYVDGRKVFQTQTPVIEQTVTLLKALGMLEEEFSKSWEHKPAEYFKTS